MKGQVSTELLVIVAFVLLIFIPLLVLVYFKASEANQQIASYQAELAVSRVASLSNSVGSLGTNTSLVTDVYVPVNTISLKTANAGEQGSEVILRVVSPQGETEIVDIMKYQIANPSTIADSSTAGGWMRIKITSEYSAGNARIRIERVS